MINCCGASKTSVKHVRFGTGHWIVTPYVPAWAPPPGPAGRSSIGQISPLVHLMAPSKKKLSTAKRTAELEAALAASLAANKANVSPEPTRAIWTHDNEHDLAVFLNDHRAEAGDGMNFKGAVFTRAAAEVELNRTRGGIKNPRSCKNKWAKVRLLTDIFYSLLTIYATDEGDFRDCTQPQAIIWPHLG